MICTKQEKKKVPNMELIKLPKVPLLFCYNSCYFYNRTICVWMSSTATVLLKRLLFFCLKVKNSNFGRCHYVKSSHSC